MVRPVRPWPYRFLREKKWRCLDSNLGCTLFTTLPILTYACVIECRTVSRSLGRLRGLLRTFSSLQASNVATRESRVLIIYIYIYIAILEREVSSQIGEDSRRAWRSARFNRFSSYRNYWWGDSSSILVQIWLRSDLRISWESMPPDPPSLFTPQWPYQSKIAGSGPGISLL